MNSDAVSQPLNFDSRRTSAEALWLFRINGSLMVVLRIVYLGRAGSVVN